MLLVGRQGLSVFLRGAFFVCGGWVVRSGVGWCGVVSLWVLVRGGRRRLSGGAGICGELAGERVSGWF